MKAKTVLILILILLLACVPCLVSLAEGDSESSPAAPESSESAEIESSSSDEQESESSDSDGGDSDSSESDESESSTRSKSSSEPQSSSSGSRFAGDPVQGKTPKFADLKLGDGDPDDGKDFKLEPEENDGYYEVTIRNKDAKGMKGNDNFRIEFDGCDVWVPIEIPASCVEDDHINSKLVVSHGPISESMMDKVTSSISPSRILQTFSLALTSYDVKGQPTEMNSFDGKIKFVRGVNAACVNQYNRDGKLALMLYDTESRTLSNVEYTLDPDKGEITVYASGSGSFFLINSEEIDTTTAIKLNSNAPFLKIVLITGALMSIGASIALIALAVIKNRKNRSAKTKE
ncbi:MAG: hypothetical protein J5441_05885 [Clostridia bacterium]|nr:hypothetical protein [Clostridia bacterium]